MSEHDARLNELELLFMQQSQQVEELSSEVALCHRRIDDLERANRALHDMVQGMAPELEESPDE
jgi:uncharacterized coiled-coil protein SlyX